MRTTRIELEGNGGRVEVSRERGKATIYIASITSAPGRGDPVMKTWELPARVGEDELFQVAEEVQRRCDGTQRREFWRVEGDVSA